jgi:uncharacterized protein (DUF1330 family)
MTEPTRVPYIEANDLALAEMRTGDPEAPIVMLNMLKFRAKALDGFGVDGMTGGEAFRRYGELNAKNGVTYGAEPIWAGRADHTIIGDEDWDLVILVRYPSRQHFVDKVADPTYREIARIRAAALADSRLVELTQLLPRP